jgi:zinc transport system substrate-binding protein
VVADVLQGAEGKEQPSRSSRSATGAFRTELRGLDSSYRSGLTRCESDILVTTHAAFGYLTDRYGLRQEPITGLSPEGEPDPARLAEIEDLIREEHVTTVFTEPLASSDVADTIARETGTKVAVLNPIEGLTDAERANGDDYFSIMRTNLEALRGALGCTG